MATPPSAAKFAGLFRDEGVTVVEVGDWEHHNRNHKGPWGPVHGVMIHHTVTSGSARTVAICRDGYSSLPGPLCHGVITKDGRVHLVGYGRANHAGLGDDDVLRAVMDEKTLPADNETSTDGNRHFYGFECENLGDGKDPWPAAQLLAIEKAAAALCRHHGWGAGSVIGHLEWQPGKVDPRGFSMQTMRGRIAARLDGNQQEDEVTPEDIKKVATAVVDQLVGARRKDLVAAIFQTDDVLRSDQETNPYWYGETFLREGRKADDAIRAKLDTLAAGGIDLDVLAAKVAAAPGLADGIAEKVAANLAERLAE